MSKTSIRQEVDQLRHLLESWTNTKWKVRTLEPDGCCVAWSEMEGDAIKLLAKDLATAKATWQESLEKSRWNKRAA